MNDRTPSVLAELAIELSEVDRAKACDSHIHINDPKYRYSPDADLHPPPATVSQYKSLQARLGTGRVVVIQPSSYGTDNRCTLDAVERFGASARAVIVVEESVTDAMLQHYHGRGVRGVRFNLMRPSPVAVGQMASLASRIADLGWHLQLHADPKSIVMLGPVLERLPVPVVFDHLGRLTHAGDECEAAYSVVTGLLDQGRAWVKLSGAELDGVADAPDYFNAARLACAFIGIAPDKVVWGSNWPHPATSKTGAALPDDPGLLAWLLRCAPDPRDRYRILVSNPADLYGFER